MTDQYHDPESLPLLENDAPAEPFSLFSTWFAYAQEAKIPQPEAMTLATACPDGRPAARTVLLKQFGPEGFVFFTNHDSQKGQDLSRNPQAELLFFWSTLERQIRIFGQVVPLSREASLAYYHSRPRGSQLSAWASPQSQVVAGREELEARWAETKARFTDQNVPLPPFWGGFRVVPEQVEFWQGRAFRLHDRLRYLREEHSWRMERLAP